jgi:hypothetical protein
MTQSGGGGLQFQERSVGTEHPLPNDLENCAREVRRGSLKIFLARSPRRQVHRTHYARPNGPPAPKGVPGDYCLLHDRSDQASRLGWCRSWCRLTAESDRTLSKSPETSARHKFARPLTNARQSLFS